ATRVSRQSNGYTLTGTLSCWGEGTQYDDNCFPEITRRIDTNSTTWRVARGVLDAENRFSLHTPTPMQPGVAEDLRFPLMAHDYTFRAGNQIGLVVLGSLNGYYDAVPGRTITLDLRSSRVELPVVGGLR